MYYISAVEPYLPVFAVFVSLVTSSCYIIYNEKNIVNNLAITLFVQFESS